MQENIIGEKYTFLDKFLIKNDYQFIKDLAKKIYKAKTEIDKMEDNKELIIKKIVDKSVTNNPKNKREYEKNSETAIESVNIISKNLYELSSNYNTIERLSNSITRRYNEGLAEYSLTEDINRLTDKIKDVEELENKIEEDNKKNYLIIKNFFENTEDKDENDYEEIEFQDITMDNLTDRPILKICEKRVELPYTKKEIQEFMKEYPNDYKTPQDVISKEFISNISIYKKHPILSRFKETYYLCRAKEMMNIFDSFNYAKDMMFRSEINSYIIAAVKSVRQLDDYIECLENNKVDEYKHFKIIFEINPTVVA